MDEAVSERDDLIHYLLDSTMETAANCPEAERVADAYRDQILREAAAKLRAWGEDGEKRRDLGQAQSPFYMWEDADSAADLIDPNQEQP